MDTLPLLVTIPFSHYCEKARWALEHVGIAYREERHMPVFHWLATLPRGGGRTVPMLRIADKLLCDSTDIVRYADRQARPERRLYSADPHLDQEIVALEDRFDEQLGPATRRLVYFYLLPDRAMALRLISMNMPRWQQVALPSTFSLVRAIIRRGLNITPSSAERSLARTREIFAQVSDRPQDGRSFLCGNRFSAADFTFASLAAPVLLPREYGVWLPDTEDIPAPLADIVRELRQTPAGIFGLRLYRERRNLSRLELTPTHNLPLILLRTGLGRKSHRRIASTLKR